MAQPGGGAAWAGEWEYELYVRTEVARNYVGSQSFSVSQVGSTQVALAKLEVCSGNPQVSSGAVSCPSTAILEPIGQLVTVIVELQPVPVDANVALYVTIALDDWPQRRVELAHQGGGGFAHRFVPDASGTWSVTAWYYLEGAAEKHELGTTAFGVQ